MNQNTQPIAPVPFQARVKQWVLACLGEGWEKDFSSRNHHFLEVALKLVQACGCTESEAHQIVQYGFRRPAGEPYQEAGGVSVALSALCESRGINLEAAAEAELARIWPLIDSIRARILAKPKFLPLPIAKPLQRAVELLLEDAANLKQAHTIGDSGDWTGEPEAKAAHDELLAVAAALPVSRALPTLTRATNDQLGAFGTVWKLNGDWLTCRGCDRSLLASRNGDLIDHKAGCKFSGQQHPWKLLTRILTGVS